MGNPLFARKPMSMLLAEAQEVGGHSLKRTLGPVQLTALGVGAVIGAGIFVFSGLGAHYAGSAWVGLVVGVCWGLMLGAVHAVASIRFKADQIVVGVAINLFAVGITRFFLQLAFGSSSNSPRVTGFGGAVGECRVSLTWPMLGANRCRR